MIPTPAPEPDPWRPPRARRPNPPSTSPATRAATAAKGAMGVLFAAAAPVAGHQRAHPGVPVQQRPRVLHRRRVVPTVFDAGSWSPRQGEFGITTILAGTLIVTGIAMLVAAPLGLGAAIYLSEYAQPARTVLKPILEVLAGHPVGRAGRVRPQLDRTRGGRPHLRGGEQQRQHDGGRHCRGHSHHPAGRLRLGGRHAGGAQQPAGRRRPASVPAGCRRPCGSCFPRRCRASWRR